MSKPNNLSNLSNLSNQPYLSNSSGLPKFIKSKKFAQKLANSFELFFCCIFLAMMPLSIGVQNIAYGIFILFWLINRLFKTAPHKDFGGHWRYFDTLILAWILIDIFINTFSYFRGTGFSGSLDMLQYLSVLWVFSRSHYNHRTIYLFFTLIFIGTVLGLTRALTLYLQHHHDINYFLLETLGQRNHTAIFIVLIFGLAMSLFLAFFKQLNFLLKLLFLILIIALISGLLLSASRAAFGAMFMVLFILAIIWGARSNIKITLGLIIFLLLGATVTFIDKPIVMQRELNWQASVAASGTFPRECLYHGSWLLFQQHPIIGVGSHNYGKFDTKQNLTQLLDQTYKNPADRPCIFLAPHSHNLYLNTLVEMGIIGFIPLGIFLLSWLIFLLRHFPDQKAQPIAKALWDAALCAFFIDTGIGLVNTTIHHGHALITMVILGLALSYFYRQRGK